MKYLVEKVTDPENNHGDDGVDSYKVYMLVLLTRGVKMTAKYTILNSPNPNIVLATSVPGNCFHLNTGSTLK